jgi:hypothetical protein
MLQCHAQIVGKAEFTKIRTKLYRRYPQYEKEAPIELVDSIIVALEPAKKFSWGM